MFAMDARWLSMLCCIAIVAACILQVILAWPHPVAHLFSHSPPPPLTT
jgi:hypothetical protein